MRRLCLLLPVVVLLAACGGGPPGDVFIVKRSGTLPGAKLKLEITDDGGAYCNNGPRNEITSEQLIEAREIRRILNGDPNDPDKVPGIAKKNLTLPASGQSFYDFGVRSEEGTLNFHETTKGQPVIPRIVKITRDIAIGSCGLKR